MNSNITISIIVPIFNTPISIFRRCYKSLLNQTYPNIQIIVIDDGSEKENSKKYEEILSSSTIYKRQTNKGVSAARNNGVTMASGNYVTFVDSDDELENSFIEQCVEKIMSANLDMLITGKKIVRNNKVVDIWQPNPIVAEKTKEANEEIAINNYLYVSAGSFVSTSIAKTISFDEEIRLGEDTLYLISATKIAKNIGVSNYSGYKYDKSNSTLSKGNNIDDIYNYIAANHCFVDKLEKEMGINNAIKDAILSIKTYEALSMLCDHKTSYSQFAKLLRKSNIHPISLHSLKRSTYSFTKKILILIISRQMYPISYACLRLKSSIKKCIKR